MIKKLFAVVFVLVSFSEVFSMPLDSIGIEKQGGKTFILHQVEPKQTLAAILKKYKCTKEALLAANPYLKSDSKINLDQILRIPTNQHIKTLKKEVAKKEITPKIEETPTKDDSGIVVIDIPEATPKEEPVIKKSPSKVEIVEENPKISDENEQSATPPTTKKVGQKGKTHKVAPNETLYSIASKNHVSVAQMKIWNKMKSDIVHENQVLLVENPWNKTAETEEISKPAKEIKVASKAIKPKNDTVLAEAKTPTKSEVQQGPAGDAEKPTKALPKTEVVAAPTYVPNAPSSKKTFENGVAEVIDAGERTEKYLALHKTATVGTLIQVKNEANGLSVWVKVIGKLPDSDDVLIKISPKAFEKLQPKERRIRAEISYVK